MANTKIVTNSFKLNAIQQLIESISEPANTIYYVFAGKSSPYANSDQDIVTPNNSVQSTLVEPYDEMVFAKQVTSQDVKVMIPRYNWTSGEVYTQYTHKDGLLNQKPFYAVVNATSTYYVYKCLYNNNGANSTQQPTFSDTSADDEYYETSDGYQWKYMYKVDATTFNKFATVDYMPVVPDANVSGNAAAGAIDVIQVTAAGAKYNNYYEGQFNTSDVKIDGNPLKYAIEPEASSVPEYYTGCIIKITAGTGVGQYRTITRYDVSSLKYIFIDSPFNVVPDATTQYEIMPSVLIVGDGKQSVNAAARALVNTIGNTIHRVEMLNRGEGYFIASANVIADSVVGVSNTATLDVIIGPKNGHGFDAESELYGSRLGISVKFSNTESGTIPTDNDFRQIGLLKDPKFGELTLYYDTPSGTFIDEEEIFQLELYRLSGSGTVAQTAPDIFGTGTLCGIIIVSAGTATYNNTDVITVSNVSVNAVANLTTNSTGGLASISIVSYGSGFSGNSLLTVSVANSVGGNIRHFNGNGVSSITINDGGLKYSNSDYIVVSNGNINAEANVITNANGTITSIVITDSGNGFLNTSTIDISVVNSTYGHTYGKKVGNVTIITGGAGFDNSDIITIGSSLPDGNASANIVTDGAGTIITLSVNTSSNNYGFTNTLNTVLTIANSTGGDIRALNADQTIAAVGIVANNPVSKVESITVAATGTGYNSTKVVSVEILDGGYGYNSTVNNEISISSPGSGATASFTNNVNGKITSVTVLTPGTGYDSTTVASVTVPGDYGVGAEFEVHLSDELVFTSNVGYGAKATYANDASGNVTTTLVTNGGFGYTNSSLVSVQINGDAGGTGANLQVVLIGQANIFSNSDVLTISNAVSNATANIVTTDPNISSWSYITTGQEHSAALKTAGQLYMWGSGAGGGLGFNDTVDKSSPVQLGTSSWSAVSCGNQFSMAIRTDGRLFTWGKNNAGQLGDGTATDSSNPSAVDSSTSWIAISAGLDSAFAIRSDGGLFAWGSASAGKTGLNTTTATSSPTQIGTDSWIAVTAGESHTVAIKSGGTLWAWGMNLFGQLGDGDAGYILNPVSTVDSWSVISMGQSYGTAVRSDGGLFAWGFNSAGQLGDGTASSKVSPVQIGSSSWITVSAGSAHTLAIRADGGLFAWGNGSNGRLGDNTATSKNSPVQIGTSSWIAVSAGNAHSLAIRLDGKVFGWGANTSGRIGDNTTVTRSSPVAIAGAATNSSFTLVSAGEDTSFAITTLGALWVWGNGGNGTLGLNATATKSSPVQLGADSWTLVQVKRNSVLGIRDTGALFAWGDNSQGVLGLNDTTTRSSPVQVGASSWTAVALGHDRTAAAIDINGRLFTWGFGEDARLGDKTNVSRSSPVQVGTSSWTAVSVGAITIGALRTGDTRFFTVGANTLLASQLGREVNKSSPVQVGSSTWSHIAAGEHYTTAIRSDGGLFSWGRDSSQGVLGLNTSNTYIESPVQVGSSSWTFVTAGRVTTLAKQVGGSLWAWGLNNGNYGDGTSTTRSSPVQVGTSSWTVIGHRSRTNHTLGLIESTIYGWGSDNSFGQIGDLTIDPQLSPVVIGTSPAAELAYLLSVILTNSGSQFQIPFPSIANSSGGYVRYFNDTIVKSLSVANGYTTGLFTNTDIGVVTNGSINAVATVTTNSVGGLANLTITQTGKGFANHSTLKMLVTNSTSGYVRRLNTNVCANVVIVDGGIGYNNSDYIVVLNGGGNAYANLTTNSTGGIISVQVTDAGFGFDSGKVIAVLVDEPGTLYQPDDIPVFEGGGGQGAAAKVAVDANGAVTYVYITDGGIGYDCPPVVTLPSATGTLIELTAFVAPGAAARILNANGFGSDGTFAELEPTIVRAPDVLAQLIYAPNLAITVSQSANLIPVLIESANLTVTLSESANLAPDLCGLTTDFINQISNGDYIFMTTQTGLTDFATVNVVTNSSHMTITRNVAFTDASTTLYRANVVARGTVTSMGAVNSSIDYVTVANVSGFFTVNNDIVGESSRASGNVTAILFNNIPKSFLTMNQLQAHRGTLTGTFVEDEYVYVGNSEIANARYHSGNSTMIFLTQPRGDFTVGLTITGNSSGASFVINDKYDGDISRGSGDVMYIENIQPVSRANTQSETIKLIVEF